MKKLERLPPPQSWDGKIPEVREKLQYYYAKITTTGKITDYWNKAERMEPKGKRMKVVRLQLLLMSHCHCAYCGKRINAKEAHVEHYLPKSEFREIAYAWLNFLPSCEPCNNRRKKTFVPLSLKGKRIVDAVLHNPLETPPPDFVFDGHYHVHRAINDRLIDPSFDNPDEHLEFDVLSSEYLPKTEIGRITNEQMFSDDEPRRAWSELIEEIRDFVKFGMPYEKIERFIKKYGYEYIGWEAYQYWSEQFWIR